MMNFDLSPNAVFDFYKKNKAQIHQQPLFTDTIQQIQYELLCGDMSYKQFFRIKTENRSYILITIPTAGEASIETFCGTNQLSLCPADNFINSAIMLAEHISHVSPVHGFDRDEGLVLLTDHGTVLFDNYVKINQQQTAVIFDYFSKLFAWIAEFQKLPEKIPQDFFGLQRIFEKNALKIELEEYIKYGICYYKKQKNISQNMLENFASLAKDVAAQPLTLIHRDFQSKNILLENNDFWVIDYQDLCYGPYTYDYASLIFDPYLDLNSEVQQQLIQICWKNHFSNEISYQNFCHDIYQCAMHRLFKAAGRYSRQLALTGKDSHMKYFEPAVKRALELQARTNKNI